MKPAVLKRKRDKYPLENSPLKRENRLSAVTTNQAERIVARPHHKAYFKGKLGVHQSYAAKLSNQILSPFMNQPFIKAIVSERWSRSRAIPTHSPDNRQSDPIVNR